jgi:hypothetical protein
MNLRLIRNTRRLAVGSFVFFLVKGLVWLAVGAFATAAAI